MAIEEWGTEGEEAKNSQGREGDGIIVIPRCGLAGEEGVGEPLLLKSNGKREKGSVAVVLLSVGVAVWGAFVFGTCVGFSAPSQAGMMKDLGLSLSEFSTFGSILNIGAMFGATTSGYIADFIGRKGAMRISSMVCLLGWMSIYYAKGIMMLCIGRISTGYGIGIFSYVVPIYIAEISPKNIRGGLTTLNQVMVAVGASSVSICGIFAKWKTLILVGAVPCVALLIGSIFIPESPRWMAKLGDEDKVKDSLQKLRGKDANINKEAMEIKDYIDFMEAVPKTSLKDLLFQMGYRRSITIGVGLMIFQQFIGVGGIGFYASQLFVEAGFESGNISTAIMGSIQVSATGALMGMLVATMSFFLKEQGYRFYWTPITALVGILIFAGSFSIGMASIPWVIMSEIFPLNTKKIGGSLATLVNWFGSWVTSYSFNFLMAWSSSGTLSIYSTICALSILFIAKVVPETKGKTLEEIQASLNC